MYFVFQETLCSVSWRFVKPRIIKVLALEVKRLLYLQKKLDKNNISIQFFESSKSPKHGWQSYVEIGPGRCSPAMCHHIQDSTIQEPEHTRKCDCLLSYCSVYAVFTLSFQQLKEVHISALLSNK
ncbi:uncharacterized protein LOC124374944 [Homalodisca vitripennis]|uniref:uncharacterized protein LOC124374944 n=1 Tax=Homalodisca vitripennis TaxID=197043 RepID=UPI001EEB8B5D|nr:uncharacterized protein LOC124374944 [Homalodisca vitripennis]